MQHQKYNTNSDGKTPKAYIAMFTELQVQLHSFKSNIEKKRKKKNRKEERKRNSRGKDGKADRDRDGGGGGRLKNIVGGRLGAQLSN